MIIDTPSVQVSCCLEDDPTVCDHANVTLNVIDLNDNSPEFNKKSYAFEIPIDQAAGSEIMYVKATDKDSKYNGEVGYALKNGTGLGAFVEYFNSGLCRCKS